VLKKYTVKQINCSFDSLIPYKDRNLVVQ